MRSGGPVSGPLRRFRVLPVNLGWALGSVRGWLSPTRGDRVDADFAEFVRHRGEHHLRTAVLLTGDWHAAEDLMQSCLGKLYKVWHRLDTSSEPDAYLRRILVNTHRSWWRARWRREIPRAEMPELVPVTWRTRGPWPRTFATRWGSCPPGSARPWCCVSSPTCPKRRSPI
ncbi:sigma factor [Sphaerisporangium sp. NPDC051017]|uniref:sigma factor n=1 Tax=Sphaerisporangium sp. NPDC051017 TaxID=3154636 RepID=UPI00343E4B97